MCSCFFVILISAPRGSGWLATLAAIYIAAKQQSRRRYAANGFAFVPHTCRVPVPHTMKMMAVFSLASGRRTRT